MKNLLLAVLFAVGLASLSGCSKKSNDSTEGAVQPEDSGADKEEGGGKKGRIPPPPK